MEPSRGPSTWQTDLRSGPTPTAARLLQGNGAGTSGRPLRPLAGRHGAQAQHEPELPSLSTLAEMAAAGRVPGRDSARGHSDSRAHAAAAPAVDVSNAELAGLELEMERKYSAELEMRVEVRSCAPAT